MFCYNKCTVYFTLFVSSLYWKIFKFIQQKLIYFKNNGHYMNGVDQRTVMVFYENEAN